MENIEITDCLGFIAAALRPASASSGSEERKSKNTHPIYEFRIVAYL